MESDVMDAEGSLHQKPRDVCATDEMMDDEGSLYQKSNEVCIAEDAESIDLGCFENKKLNRGKNGIRCLLQVGVRDWESLGASPPKIKKEFVKQWQKSWIPKWKENMKFILR